MRSTVGVVLLVVLRAASGAALGRVLVVGARSTEHALSPSDTPRDAQTLRQTLSRLRREREWDVAHSLLWEQLQEQPELVEPVHCNIVLSSLSEAPRRPEWERALVLLEHMPTVGLTPDAYTYSAAISACARGGQSEHAVNTFKAMCASDVPPNNVVYNNVLSACQRAQQHKTLLALFATMLIKGVAPDAWACSAAIGARDKDGDHQGALDMFDTLMCPQRSVHTYAAAMLAAKHAERPAKAVSLYEEMLEHGIVPSPQTLGIALGVCARADHHSSLPNAERDPHSPLPNSSLPNWQTALRLLSEAPRVAVDVQCFDAAIRACASSGRWRDALALLEEIERRGLKPTVHSFTGAINAQKQDGRWRTSVELLQRMKALGLKLDSHALSAALGVCGAAGEWRVALKILQGMGRHEIQVNSYHLEPVVRSCTNAGEWARALALVAYFEERGIELSSEARDAALCACAKGGEGRRALQILEGAHAPDSRMYGSTIVALGAQDECELAMRVLKQAEQAGAASAKCYNAAVGALEQAGRRDEARRLRKRAKDTRQNS